MKRNKAISVIAVVLAVLMLVSLVASALPLVAHADELDDLKAKKAELSAPLPFTKGMPVLKIPQQMNDSVLREYGELLFDLENDPDEEQNLQDPDMILKMRAALVKKLKESDAPEEVYRRFRLTEI